MIGACAHRFITQIKMDAPSADQRSKPLATVSSAKPFNKHCDDPKICHSAMGPSKAVCFEVWRAVQSTFF